MAPSEPSDWLDHDLAEPLLRLNLLPTSLMHPSRRAGWARDDSLALSEAVLDRHESSAWLETAGLPLVKGLDDPRLPICMAPPPLFERLCLACGSALLWPALRRVIVRAELAELVRQLGEDCLALVRRLAALGRIPPSAADEAPPLLERDVREQALRSGQALVAVALQDAPPELAERGLLRLPREALSQAPLVPRDLREPPRALEFLHSVLQEIDAPWLSSFPARP